MSLKDLSSGGSPRQLMITDISFDESELKLMNANVQGAPLIIENDLGKKFGCLASGVGCLHVPAPANCSTRANAAATLRRLVGNGFKNVTVPVTKWSFQCVTANKKMYILYPGDLQTPPVTASCTSSSVDIQMQGRVGENVTASGTAYIQCSTEATVRLTIPADGRVKVGGEGEVQLKFPRTGSAIRDVTGTDTLVVINAELTKSPTLAGTYQGSTFLLLDVL